ncbi:putative tetratricopeptide-like helical domain superfamily [Helianthus annuus]|uniref:Putative pentatricopeptide repeat protein n=1 Tax=Helianthus annuus TaxID=4232 RepID=A0A251S9B5_HELAN|nr:putative tetratricopeptide-like helical domain superfamily [Helianthus annuus]KAJ0473554.1 putative tetratricopeptide-like helical domain superfamily [Helianthus annuus]KAJ0649133.1 putative tetratricopeptide-like helical domain superfamily [Helianthus annuus]KAJ0652932.1 putative tetratricopeptide-like helical domain superfamily [Helianthus annuus]
MIPSHFTKTLLKTLNPKPIRFFHSSPSPSRIHKLISSQSDPLVAYEIFHLSSKTHPNFHHSYSTIQTLILKLPHSRHFSLMNSLLSSLKHDRRYTLTPSLFTHIIRIYGETNSPEKALKTFYTMLEFDVKPRPKQLNVILEILVSERRYLRPAFELFKSVNRYGVCPNVESYNILMRAFCLNGDLSVAYQLFGEMSKRDVMPNVESYRILMQGLCRKSQVNRAVELLEDMLNKGFVPDGLIYTTVKSQVNRVVELLEDMLNKVFVPDGLIYTTVLNSLCRKKKLREVYKVLCRMKVKGCDLDIVHYNTVLEDMDANGCLPNLVSYQTLVGGLCSQGLYDEAKSYIDLMVSKGFSPHVSVWHVLVNGLCGVGKVDAACSVLEGDDGGSPKPNDFNT